MAGSVRGPAFDLLREYLHKYQLDGLSEWAWDQLVDGKSADEVIISLRDQDTYKQRFRGLMLRQERGAPMMTEDEYISWEKQAATMMHQFGMPAGFYDQPEDFAEMIGHSIGMPELQDRLNMYADAAEMAPQEVRDALADLYGVGTGGLAAYYADPERGLQVLQRQFQAAKVAGSAQRHAFGALTAEEAERLATLGIDEEAANEQFGLLSTLGEAVNALPGEAGAGLDRRTILDAVGGDAAARERLRRRTQTRLALNVEGGGYASGRGGFTGIGSSQVA